MFESASLTSVLLAFASFYAAGRTRRPARFLNLATSWSPAALRLLGVLLLALSVAQWSRGEGLAAALLVVLATFGGVATLFVLLAPVAPRAVWGITVACVPAEVVLSLLGVVRG